MRYPRRTALKVISVGAMTAFTGKVALAQQMPHTRRTLTGMPLDDPDLSTYRDFVDMMINARDQSQPLSWLGFASQHGTLLGGYKFCPHGDWYLLPWHRAYVLMYETAAQVLMKNKDFAMPYWNWTEMRTLPEAFANSQYKGKPNPLFVPNRNQFSLPDSIVGQTQVIDRINAETVFEAFGTTRNTDQTDLDPSWVPAGGGYQGTLEKTPHNLVHNTIGAFMPTPASPRDPVFFMHHANIDRIWASWNALGRQNSTDPLWLNMPFTNNYLGPDGTPYTASVRDLKDIAPLGYTYDFMPPPDHVSPDPARDSRLLALLHSKPGEEVAGAQRFGGAPAGPASVLGPLSQKLMLTPATLAAVAAPAAGTQGAEVYALITKIEMGAGVSAVRVFLNRPDLSTEVPDTDPHYVTTFSFLNHGTAGGGHGGAVGSHKQPPSALVSLTATLRRLYGFRRLRAGEITVQLIPVAASGLVLESVGKVVPASVEIVVV